MMTHEAHVTTMDLDLVALDQASPEARARIEAHAAACAACAGRRAEHDDHVRHFRTVVFPRTAERLAARVRPRFGWRLTLSLVLPVAAGVVFLARGHFAANPDEATPPANPISSKGGPGLQVFAQHRDAAAGGGVTRVKDGDRLAAGDALRFVLLPTTMPYALIASVDGAGKVSIYYPYQGETSARLAKQGSITLPFSIQLDQAPGPERIFAIFSREPLAADVARQELGRVARGGWDAIRATGVLPIAGTAQSTLVIEKASAP